jgi:predicted RNA-binding Zn-ribbon protein involved in translation (DUF1610 family)
MVMGGLGMPVDDNIGLGKNIVYGLLFFVVIALGCGFGSFISIVASGDDSLGVGLIGSLMIIFFGPVVALIVGIIQGKKAKDGTQALIAGGVAGVIGYILLMFIVVGFIGVAVGIRFPDTGDGDVSFNLDLGQFITEFIAIFLPTGIIGALSALLSKKLIFGEPAPMVPGMQEPTFQPEPSAPQPQIMPIYQQQPEYSQAQHQQIQQPQEQYPTFNCPHCGKPFRTHKSDRPRKVICPSCSQEVIVGL